MLGTVVLGFPSKEGDAHGKESFLIVAMAEKCKRMLREWDEYDSRLPKALQQEHLVWMCNKIEEHSETGPATKLHRWIGFVQGAMLHTGYLISTN